MCLLNNVHTENMQYALPFSAWAQAVAALMIIGLIILIIAFIISCVALCCTLNIPLLPFIGVLLMFAGKNSFEL